MALEWTHTKCAVAECDGSKDCPAFPTVADRVNMARAAYQEYAEADGTSLEDFGIDVLMLVSAEDKTGLLFGAVIHAAMAEHLGRELPNQTAKDRKQGLRAAVEAKLKPERSHVTAALSRLHEVRLLWEIIDSLVDEVEPVRAANRKKGS